VRTPCSTTSRFAHTTSTGAFFEALLDLKPGYRPDFPFPGAWLYADGEPVVHLIPGSGGPVDRRGETIDHVGFRLKGYDGYRRKLDALGIPYSTMELSELGERRLFVSTPRGILLELVFREGDAASNSQRSDRHA